MQAFLQEWKQRLSSQPRAKPVDSAEPDEETVAAEVERVDQRLKQGQRDAVNVEHIRKVYDLCGQQLLRAGCSSTLLLQTERRGESRCAELLAWSASS